MQSCHKVEELKLWAMSRDQTIAGLQNLQLSKLKVLGIEVRQKGNAGEALRLISQGTGALRQLHLSMGRQKRKGWEAVASANPLLEDVKIGIYLDDEGEYFYPGRGRYEDIETIYATYGRLVTEQEIIDIVESFSIVQALQQLVIHDVNDLDNMIKRVHRRAKIIQDASLPLQYRPWFLRYKHTAVIVPHVSILGVNYIA